MNPHKKIVLIETAWFLLLTVCVLRPATFIPDSSTYKPDSPELYNTIIRMDSIFFDAYNNCDLSKQAEIYSDSIEFYHDQGGLMTSKKLILEATEKNICGKVRRKLEKGSVEVYPINDFGAVEIGLHTFYNNSQPADAPHKPSKFIIIWQNEKGSWKIKRVVSLH